MNSDYQSQLKTFAFSDSREKTISYLQKYWLDKERYLKKWAPIQQGIFSSKFHWIPDEIFNDHFEITILRGGLIFVEEDFYSLINCAKKAGDNYFVIIEDYDESKPPHTSGPLLRFEYPIDITWEEMNETANGDIGAEGICYQIFQRPIRNYFIFGDSGNWGKYTANDYEMPMDIIGYKPIASKIFNEAFKQSKDELEEMRKWVPENYKKYILSLSKSL